MRLASVTKPENGTASYVYDAYNRLSMVKRYPVAGGNEDLTQRTTFEYDLGTGQNLWGRLARIVYGNGMQERYSYTGSGLVAQKTQAPAGNLSPALSLDYTWDNEGQVTSVTYPETGVPREGGGYDPLPRRVVSYTRDAAGRVQNVVSGGVTMAGNAQYNAAGQLVGYSAPGGGFGFTYNSRGQMTAQSGITYTYSATANDGRLVSRRDVASGEEVTYLYDELGRLAEAATVGPTWGLRWTFDGFGNRLSQIVTKGTGPAVNLTVNAATNRIAMSGFLYDANGNQTQWTAGLETWTANYDIENRVTQVATPWATDVYTYNAANQRVVKDNPYGSRTVDSVYGLGGELLGEYERCWTGGGWNVPCNKQERSYLGGRLIEVEGATKAVDRIGMSTALSYPYLENTGGPEATWKRDLNTGLDYAWNRYYSGTWGRFTSADPYQDGANPSRPQSWNAYAYAANDPANLYDPTGLQAEGPRYGCPYTNPEDWLNCDWEDPQGSMGGGGGLGVASSRRAMPWPDLLRRIRDAAAIGVLLRNKMTASGAPIPAFLQVTSMCWAQGVPSAGTMAYTLQVTYQILDSSRNPMTSATLAGITISESFWEVSGAIAPQEHPGSWTTYTTNGIQPNGTFTDYLSAGGFPPITNPSGSAIQGFYATGFLSNGMPLLDQPLTVLGVGVPTTTLFNSYGQDNVTVNGVGLGRNPVARCH